MKKVCAVLLLFLGSFFSANAQQKQGANWFFGGWSGTGIPGTHLNFNGQTPSAIPFSSDYSFGSGAATMSDRYGQLLFFSNSGVVQSRQILNNKYQEMPNGKVFQNNIYSTSELIVPSPADEQVYYIFFVRGAWAMDTFDLFVSQVDMRLNNGFGDVVPNSTQLLKANVGPGLAAMLHTNNRHTWVLSYINTSDSLQAFLIDQNGIAAPVISTPGKVLSSEGRIKSSPNSELVAAIGTQHIEIFQFDRGTGVVSALHSLTLPNPNLQRSWAFAFSPDNSKLYAGTRIPSPSPPNATYSIVQFDLASGNTAQIQQSVNTIYIPGNNENGSGIMDMQLAIDGKIYVSRSDSLRHLSVITCPDNYGSDSGFKLRGVDALQKYYGNGSTLPALNQTIFRNAGFLQAQALRDTICYGDSVQLSAYGAGAERFLWQLANGLTSPDDTLANPFVKPTQTTTYKVTGWSVCSHDTVSVTVVVLPKPTVTVSGSASVCPQVQGVWYKANNPEKLPISWGVKGGTVVTTSNDSISVNWGNASNTAQVWALPSNRLGCPGDTVFFPVTINIILATETPKGTDTLCLNEAKNINYRIAPTTGSVYTWGIKGGTIVSGQGSNSIRVNWQQAGNNKLWVQEESRTSTSHCFGVSDTLHVFVQPSPDSILSIQGAMQVYTLTENQLYEIENPQTAVSYHWQVSGGQLISGQGSETIRVNWEKAGTGTLEVSAKNAAGCESNKAVLKVDISGSPLPVFYNMITPNHDGKNDAFVIENLKWYPENELKIYNRWGVEVYSRRNYQNDWQAEKVSSGVYYYRFQTGKKTWKGWLEVVK